MDGGADDEDGFTTTLDTTKNALGHIDELIEDTDSELANGISTNLRFSDAVVQDHIRV